MHVSKVSTHDWPLVNHAIFHLLVPCVQIKEFKWVCLLTLFLNESFCVQDLVKLSVELIPIAFKLVSLGPNMLVYIIKSLHQMPINLLCDSLSILLNVLHFQHNLLQLLLYDVFLPSQSVIFCHGLSTGIRMGILDPQDPFVRRLLSNSWAVFNLLHISCYDALTAEWCTHVSIEEFVAFFVGLALAKGQRLVTSRDAHVALQDS